MAYQVANTEGLGFVVDVAGDLADILRPLREVVHGSHQAADAQLCRLPMAWCRSSGLWYAKPIQTTQVVNKLCKTKNERTTSMMRLTSMMRMIMTTAYLRLHAAMTLGRRGRTRT